MGQGETLRKNCVKFSRFKKPFLGLKKLGNFSASDKGRTNILNSLIIFLKNNVSELKTSNAVIVTTPEAEPTINKINAAEKYPIQIIKTNQRANLPTHHNRNTVTEPKNDTSGRSPKGMHDARKPSSVCVFKAGAIAANSGGELRRKTKQQEKVALEAQRLKHPGVKTSSDRHIKHMGIFEFVDLLNEESKYVQKDQPTASPHEIAKYAFLEVVMHKRNGHGLLCHFDEAQHCVAFYDQTKKVCSIEYAALRELISGPYNMSDPSRMRPFLAIETLRADTQSVEQGSIGGETCDIHQTRRRRKKLFRHSRRYPKHRKRYKGFSCIDKYPDGCGSDDTTPPCDRVKKIFRKLIKGSRNPMEEVTENKLLSIASCGGSSKRSHELHIISSESSAYSSGDPSDVDNLTDVCSVCSSE